MTILPYAFRLEEKIYILMTILPYAFRLGKETRVKYCAKSHLNGPKIQKET